MPISHVRHSSVSALRTNAVNRHPQPAAKAKPATRRKPPAPAISETEALVRAVAAEARGESPAVWMAVAQTIINYARKTRASVPRLVRSSYLSSNFDGNRKYYQMPLAQIPNQAAIRESVEAAQAHRSPIGDRSHFHDTSINTPSWGDRGSRMQLGRVVFFDPK